MSSQDAVRLAPKNYKVILENDKIRVLEATLKPGQKTAMHKHPNNFVYMLDAGYAKFTSAEGTSQKMRVKPGQAVWFEEQVHASENLGKKTIRGIIVELK
jgi:quercetin dioxygenase-like cupin family protein